MKQRVVITGVGAISGLGTDAQTMWDKLCRGRSAIQPLGELGAGTRISVGARVPDYDPEEHFSSNDMPLLDRFSQFAIIATRDALQNAGLAPGTPAVNAAAAIIGTGCGGKQTDEETYAGLYRDKRPRAHPLTIPKGMPSAAASQVSQHLGIKGPVFSVASACASAAHAILQGKLLIQAGLVDIAIVGGSDAPFTFGLMKAWEALRVVSSDTCRPFSNDRSGMVLGEGAGMLVLESEQHACERNGKIYAELVGCGLSSNAGHITRPDIAGISSAIASALDDAGMKPEEIGYINAHGTATATNDPAETAAIHKVFGSHANRLAVSSNKSMLGHTLGAASALELIATVLAVYHGVLPPTVNFTEAGEGCDLDYVPNIARKQTVNAALSNAFAFGGLNAVLAVSRWTHH